MYDEDHFTCAKKWFGPGDSEWVDACNGCDLGTSFTMRDGLDGYGDPGQHYPMGSVMIKAGCTLFMYYDEHYQGDSAKYEGPLNIYNNQWGIGSANNCGNGPSSYKCRCIQKPVTCAPEDQYEVVLYCDNTMGQVTTSCTYEKAIGTKYSTSLSSSMSIDVTIEEELTAQFFGLFSETLGISTTTGYNWEYVSDSTMGQLETFTVSAEAPPGLVLVIEQAVGHCDGSTAHTEMFRTSHHAKDGTVVYSKLESSPQSNKFMRAKNWAILNNKSDELAASKNE